VEARLIKAGGINAQISQEAVVILAVEFMIAVNDQDLGIGLL
jgi:hypothetical protein